MTGENSKGAYEWVKWTVYEKGVIVSRSDVVNCYITIELSFAPGPHFCTIKFRARKADVTVLSEVQSRREKYPTVFQYISGSTRNQTHRLTTKNHHTKLGTGKHENIKVRWDYQVAGILLSAKMMSNSGPRFEVKTHTALILVMFASTQYLEFIKRGPTQIPEN